MRLTAVIFMGLGMTMAGIGPVSAMDAKIYPYHARANFCPAGLQPVQIDGVICCGTPNQTISYSQAKAHPVARKHVVRADGRKLVCPIGEKGCYYE